ncbi:hypothetical protein HYFRA_00007881 [Hymenoscyphus fraxineus]|uniref:Uncharacterized protein n=1 Tax=Hymenoscyphus fraxineus TaxID=746836 RepID=A0A9N9KQA0_9HELO|nr:hypothetical protein HYFRA_00007881 [Hymenoscyphus fraxineus]
MDAPLQPISMYDDWDLDLPDRDLELVRYLHAKYANDQESLITNLSDELQKFFDDYNDVKYKLANEEATRLNLHQAFVAQSETLEKKLKALEMAHKALGVDPAKADEDPDHKLPRLAIQLGTAALYKDQGTDAEELYPCDQSGQVGALAPSSSQLVVSQPTVSGCTGEYSTCPQFTAEQYMYLSQLWEAREAEVIQDTIQNTQRKCQEELTASLVGSAQFMDLNANQKMYLSSLWKVREEEVRQDGFRLCEEARQDMFRRCHEEAQPWVQQVHDLSQELTLANASLSQFNMDLQVARGEKQQACDKFEEEKAKLKTLNEKLLSDCRYATSQYERLQKTIRAEAIDKKDYDSCVAENKYLQMELNTYRGSATAHFAQIEKSEDERDKALEDWQNAKDSVEDYKTQIDGLLNNNQNLAATVASVKTEKLEADKANKEQERKLLAFQLTMSKHIGRIEKKLANSESRNKSLEEKVECLEAANSTLQQNFDNDAACYDRSIKEFWSRCEKLEKHNAFLVRNQQKPLEKCDEELKELFRQKGAMDDDYAQRMEDNAESLLKDFPTCDQPVCHLKLKEISGKVKYLEGHVKQADKMYISIIKRSKNLLGLQMNETKKAKQEWLSGTKRKLLHSVMFLVAMLFTFFLALCALSSSFSSGISEEVCAISFGTSTDLSGHNSSIFLPSTTSTIAAEMQGVAGHGFGALNHLGGIDDLVSRINKAVEAEEAAAAEGGRSSQEANGGRTSVAVGKFVFLVTVVCVTAWLVAS